MFFAAGGLGSYDPQIVKPPEGYEGADVLNVENFKNARTASSTTAPAVKPVEVNAAVVSGA